MIEAPEAAPMDGLRRSDDGVPMAPMAIVFGSDDAYAMALGVALHSTLAWLEPGTEVAIYIVDGGINEGNRAYIERAAVAPHLKAELIWARPDTARLKDLKIGGHVTTATYFSLLVPEIVSERFERAIYLDCDILVQASIQPLWHLPFGDRALLAVRDFLIPVVSAPAGLVKYEALGIDSGVPYFNCGVLVFNLDRWRREPIADRVFRYLRQYRDYLNFRDQEGLNAVLCNDCRPIDPTWNVQSSILSHDAWPPSDYKEAIGQVRADLIRNPHIVHFVGPNKPWHLDCRHPAKTAWFDHLAQSGWCDVMRGRRAAAAEGHAVRIESRVEPEEGRVSIVLLTTGSCDRLETYLRDVLSQDFADFTVFILDDAPTDEKRAAVGAFGDTRLRYCPSDWPSGAVAGTTWAFGRLRNPFLLIQSDADALPPGFLAASVAALERNPNVGFSIGSAADAAGVDGERGAGALGGEPYRIVPGLALLHGVAAGEEWVMNGTPITIRRSAAAVALNEVWPHRKQPMGSNLCLCLASKFDVALIAPNIDVTRGLAMSAIRGVAAADARTLPPPLAAMNDAIACLSRSQRAREDDAYRGWLAERLRAVNPAHGHAIRALMPFLDPGADRRRQEIWDSIVTIVPRGAGLILVDEETRLKGELRGRTIWPFLEDRGRYWGNPASDDDAIRGLEKLRGSGISYFAITDAAFWWFDHYAGFFTHLGATYECALKTDSLVIFDLADRPAVPASPVHATFSAGG